MMRTLEVMQISMARSAPTLYSMMSGEPSVDMCGSAPMEIYTKKLNLLQKIFGYGPDTFALIMQYYYPGEMRTDVW